MTYPLRVLHVSSGNLYGGVETILATLARLRHLCPGMESHFALSYEGQLSQELVSTGAPTYLLGEARLSRPWTVLRARRQLQALLRRERFDIVICHMPWSLATFGEAARIGGHKLGFWAHGPHAGHHWLERLALRVLPDLIISNSHFTQAALVKLFPSVPGGVVYPPLALTDRPENSRSRAEIRHKLGVPDETTVIIQVSRMEPWKGHDLHLKGLSLLRELHRKWICWIVGGPQRPKEEAYLRRLRRMTAELGLNEQVQFLGYRSDVADLLAAADVFCQPNQEPEPFGIVFVESLWAGRPVVTTKIGGAMEIIDDSCGLLVPKGSPTHLAESLKRLIVDADLRRRLGQKGSERARKLCDPAVQMAELSDLCRLVSPAPAVFA